MCSRFFGSSLVSASNDSIDQNASNTMPSHDSRMSITSSSYDSAIDVTSDKSIAPGFPVAETAFIEGSLA